MPDVVRILVEKTVSSLLLFAGSGAVQFVRALEGRATRVTEKSEAHLDNIAVNYLVYALKALVIISADCRYFKSGRQYLKPYRRTVDSGVAFALAAQDTAANLFGSITVMLDHPFEIGEYIEIDGIAGTVERWAALDAHTHADQSLVIVRIKR